jgi:hypothetical protein
MKSEVLYGSLKLQSDIFDDGVVVREFFDPDRLTALWRICKAGQTGSLGQNVL